MSKSYNNSKFWIWNYLFKNLEISSHWHCLLIYECQSALWKLQKFRNHTNTQRSQCLSVTPSVWSKTTLIRSYLGGTEEDPLSSKKGMAFFMHLALVLPNFNKKNHQTQTEGCFKPLILLHKLPYPIGNFRILLNEYWQLTH